MEIPQVEPLEKIAGIQQTAFQITNLKAPYHRLYKPFEPVFIMRTESGKTEVSDDVSGVVVSGKFPDVLRDYRDRLLREWDESPHIAPEIFRFNPET